MKKLVPLSLIAATALSCSAFAADDLAGAFKEGTTSGYVRAMYINTGYKAPTDDQSTLGVGGKLGFVTGSLNGFKAGASFFTTNDFGTRSSSFSKIDPWMFDGAGKPYSLLGEAYLQYDNGKTTVKVGRQQLDTPLAGSDDIRIIPNMFEAYVVINQDVSDTTLVAAHVTKMAGLDARGSYSDFKSMSEQAYSYLGTGFDVSTTGNAGKTGVTVAGAVYTGIKDLTVQAWEYYGHEMLNAFYADATYTKGLTSDLGLTVAAQGYTIGELGKLKTVEEGLGLNTSYGVYGAKAALASASSGLTGTLAFNKVTGNDKTVTVFGAWGGYPEYAVADEFWMNSSSGGTYNAMAKSTVYKGAVDLNLGAYGLGERVVTVAYSKFDLNKAVNGGLDRDAGVTDLIYTCKPEAVKNLAIRAVYEMRDYKDNTLDSNRLKISANYTF